MNKIITCIDGSAITSAVTEAGIWSAKKLNKTLCFLHTVEKGQQHGADDYTGAIGLGARSALLEEMTKLDEQRSKVALQLGGELLDSVKRTANAHGVQHVETLHRHGDVVDAVMALEDETRLIVIGKSGMGHEGNFKTLGSHIETLLRKATQPVVLVPEQFQEPRSFMIAYDGRESADRALQKVIDGGLLHGLHCHLVSVKNNEADLTSKFDSAEQRLKAKGFKVTTAFLEGDIHDSLHAYSDKNQIELIMMGAFGHSRLRQFFVGSNTTKMIERTSVPIIVLR
ncbi:universal stress protein [Alteromonas pelagimontana]|uniref:Universal stress protein n=1 Tax=Alteromonas pelagimontana TaxID=1858656 RepID=A0A6M4MEA7_9ALTE|nr:universal stress protein [Alteromonas pelagimontana]QJR81188.1 universal stress protein [Alteromonas pelagimontana]